MVVLQCRGGAASHAAQRDVGAAGAVTIPDRTTNCRRDVARPPPAPDGGIEGSRPEGCAFGRSLSIHYGNRRRRFAGVMLGRTAALPRQPTLARRDRDTVLPPRGSAVGTHPRFCGTSRPSAVEPLASGRFVAAVTRPTEPVGRRGLGGAPAFRRSSCATRSVRARPRSPRRACGAPRPSQGPRGDCLRSGAGEAAPRRSASRVPRAPARGRAGSAGRPEPPGCGEAVPAPIPTPSDNTATAVKPGDLASDLVPSRTS